MQTIAVVCLKQGDPILDHVAGIHKSKDLQLMNPKRVVELGRGDEDAHLFFLNEVVKPIVGVKKFNQRTKVEVSEWLTPSSEAFAKLCYLNYFHLVKEDVDPSEVVSYTVNGKGAKRNQGWSNEGIKKYNDLYKAIKRDRKNDKVKKEGNRVDKRYFDLMKSEPDPDSKLKRKGGCHCRKGKWTGGAGGGQGLWSGCGIRRRRRHARHGRQTIKIH